MESVINRLSIICFTEEQSTFQICEQMSMKGSEMSTFCLTGERLSEEPLSTEVGSLGTVGDAV